MAVDLVGLNVIPVALEGGRTASNFPGPHWFMARDTAGNIVLVQWDLARQLLSFDFEGGHVTIEGG